MERYPVSAAMIHERIDDALLAAKKRESSVMETLVGRLYAGKTRYGWPSSGGTFVMKGRGTRVTHAQVESCAALPAAAEGVPVDAA